MFTTFAKGLGQLEAYTDVEEGVAFQMDNGLFWDSLGSGSQWAIEGVPEKTASSQFWVIRWLSGKVLLRNWAGLFLAPVAAGTDPQTFLIEPVQYSHDDSLQFDVFFKGNQVAFRAYNGLFLARIYREFHTLQAAMFFPNEFCCFRPLIGDVHLPTFKRMTIIPTDLSRVRYRQQLVKKQLFVNQSEQLVQHTFEITWEENCRDRMAWNRPWGLGLSSSFPFRVGDAKLHVEYNKDNDLALVLNRRVHEKVQEVVVVPPKSEATACLWVEKDNNACFPFVATILKVKADGGQMVLKEAGAWKGLAYHNLQVQVTVKRTGSPLSWCALM